MQTQLIYIYVSCNLLWAFIFHLNLDLSHSMNHPLKFDIAQQKMLTITINFCFVNASSDCFLTFQ